MDEETAIKALDLPIPENDADAPTVRQYFKELLIALLIEEEGFSGKRPFGNSGWQYDFMEPLEQAGFISPNAGHEERVALFDALVGAL